MHVIKLGAMRFGDGMPEWHTTRCNKEEIARVKVLLKGLHRQAIVRHNARVRDQAVASSVWLGGGNKHLTLLGLEPPILQRVWLRVRRLCRMCTSITTLFFQVMPLCSCCHLAWIRHGSQRTLVTLLHSIVRVHLTEGQNVRCTVAT